LAVHAHHGAEAVSRYLHGSRLCGCERARPEALRSSVRGRRFRGARDRNFGASDGVVRHDIDPWRQIADWRRAISFLESRPDVDPDRIGIWGTSYAGGHVLVLGATDRRIRAVVSQVPTISGYQQGLRRVAPDALY
jgi:dienelactone hydrolase